MPTVNTTITGTWTKLANDTDDPVLITSNSLAAIEIATVATDVAPSVSGHRLEGFAGGMGVTRSVLGDGFVFARIVDSRFASAVMVVTK